MASCSIFFIIFHLFLLIMFLHKYVKFSFRFGHCTLKFDCLGIFILENNLCSGDHVSWHNALDGCNQQIQQMLMADDPQIPQINTPFGYVGFVQVLPFFYLLCHLFCIKHWFSEIENRKIFTEFRDALFRAATPEIWDTQSSISAILLLLETTAFDTYSF